MIAEKSKTLEATLQADMKASEPTSKYSIIEELKQRRLAQRVKGEALEQNRDAIIAEA